MKSFTSICTLLAFLFLFYGCSTAQQTFQPEDVIHTIDAHQLKYKHILAYINMEMEGEDPALLNDQAYVSELTKECLEEFAEEPETFIADMEVHYEAMQYLAEEGVGMTTQTQTQTQTQSQSQLSSSGGQWQQLLSGSVLYYTAIESHNGISVQTTQIMHLCPNGTAHFYQKSGGGGGAITALSQLEYTGSATWKAIEQGGQAYLSMNMQGSGGNFPMRIVNQKIVVQGLGNFSVQQGAAQCN
jgi:hypothetical protein